MSQSSAHTNANATVVNAINNIKALLPDYWHKTCGQRLAGGAGSCYDQFSSSEEIEVALLAANWEETQHEAVAPECRVFKTSLIGRFGLIRIADMPDGTEFISDDRKGTGKISLTIAGQRGEEVEETFLIIGLEQGKEVCFTFHPGQPILPSKVSTDLFPHGSTVTKEQAVALGFEWAKLI